MREIVTAVEMKELDHNTIQKCIRPTQSPTVTLCIFHISRI